MRNGVPAGNQPGTCAAGSRIRRISGGSALAWPAAQRSPTTRRSRALLMALKPTGETTLSAANMTGPRFLPMPCRDPRPLPVCSLVRLVTWA